MKLCISLIFLFTIVVVSSISHVESGPQYQDKRRHDQIGSKECHYNKSSWSECNTKSNTRTRTLTLKKTEDEGKCEKIKTIEKKCRKVCRYEKGTWSKCNVQNEMTRTDTLRNPTESDSNCEKTKLVTKKCKNKVERPAKGQKRKHQKQQPTTQQQSQQ